MSIKEILKKQILGKTNNSPITILGRHGLSKDFVLDLETGDFYKDQDAPESKWPPCPRCGRKDIEERPEDQGKFYSPGCGGVFDRDLVVGSKK
jgi:hypothetical protein